MNRSVTHVVVTDNFAGVERYVTTVARETAARGWDVRVVGGRAQEMRDLLPAGVAWSPATTVAATVAHLTRHPSDVVHAHMTKAEVAACLTPRAHRVVATRHFAAARGRNRLVARGTDLLARRIHTELAISETVRRAAGVPGMRVLLNAVPTIPAERRPEPTVVVAQRWEREKRTVDAITAFASAGLADLGWRLVLHGAGVDEHALRRAAGESPVASSIEIAGFARDMPEVLRRAGVLLATAELEPFGLVVAEAMAAGVPVVATGSGGHLESVGRVEGARLYSPGDTSEAARLLRELAALSTEAREEYGERLRLWATANLSVQHHVDALVEVYADSLRRGGPS